MRDIPDFDTKGLRIVREIGVKLMGSFEGCVGCRECEEACIEGALALAEEDNLYKIVIRSDLYGDVPCKNARQHDVFDFRELKMVGV